MLTIEKIKTAFSVVKSGADFPKYIRNLKNIGLKSYETLVVDSHTVYTSKNGDQLNSDPKYQSITIAQHSNIQQFIHDLKIHQQGQTDYFTFCRDAAASGVEKWVVDIDGMTCTYFDVKGDEVLVEDIPEV
jgi:uncharacterized protein YbcV (DUF1398 family)